MTHPSLRRRLLAPSLLALACLTAAVPARAQEPELGAEDAVVSALANQPGLRAAESEQQAVAARTRQAGWNRAGTLETAFLYTPEQRPLQVDFPGLPPYVPALSFDVPQLATHSLTATLTQPLWTWGALSGQRQAAGREEAAGRERLTRTRQETAFEARRAFSRAAVATAAVGVAERNLEQQRAFLDVARRRHEAGAAPRLDVLKAELAVVRAESGLSEAGNAERLAREALTTVASDPRFRTGRLRPPAPAALSLPDEESAVQRAVGQRADLRALERQAEALALGAAATRAAARPSLALRASLTQQSDALGDVLGGDSRIYQASLVVGWDALQPLRSRPRVEELRAQERAVREAHRGRAEAVALEVRSSLLAAREARGRVAVEARAVLVAEEQARVARLAYREGLVTASDAQEAELALTAARFDELRALLDAALADAQLQLALGE